MKKLSIFIIISILSSLIFSTIAVTGAPCVSFNGVYCNLDGSTCKCDARTWGTGVCPPECSTYGVPCGSYMCGGAVSRYCDYSYSAPIYYQDVDGDGYGNLSTGTYICVDSDTSASGVTNNQDCNDKNAAIRPGVAEICDGVDNNCNGQVDEGFSGISESCNNIDDDCDGLIDEGLTQSCGNCGTKTCSAGFWNSCTGDNSTQSCGKCGTQSCSLEGNWTGCIEGACEIVFAYLSDMTEAPTNKADNLDKVKIITLSEQLLIGKTINVEIYKSNTLFGLGILDWLIPDSLVDNLTKTIDSQGKAVIEWTVPDVNDTTYYYAYSYVDSYSSKASWYLEVSPIESNSPPSVIISSPNYNLPENYNFNVNEIINFTQSSSDIDSIITNYSWDFDGGAPAASTSPNPVSVTYPTPGSKYISLEVIDDRGAVSTSNVGIMIDDPLTNQAPLAVITSPESGKTYSRKITVDARKSTDDRTPFEQLLFTWYFDNVKDPEHSNVSGTAGAYFDKIFDTAGLHSVAVMIDDGE